jgi:threonine aldolase
VRTEPVETNLVYFHAPEGGMTAAELAAGMKEQGVRVGAVGPTRLRACLHLDVDDAGVDRALHAIRAVLG